MRWISFNSALLPSWSYKKHCLTEQVWWVKMALKWFSAEWVQCLRTKKSINKWMGLFWNGMEYCAKSILYNRASRLQMLMWTDGFPEDIRFTWTVQKCQRICVIMTVWFDRHQRNHINKLPCNLKQKMLPDSDWCTERKGNLSFLNWAANSNQRLFGSNKKNNPKTSVQEDCLLKIDVPSA